MKSSVNVSSNKASLFLERDGVVPKNNKVYLYYRHPHSVIKNQIFEVAESRDGINFEFYNAVKSSIQKPSIIPKVFDKLLSPRQGFFDATEIFIENAFKLSSKYFVYYHVYRDNTFYVGYAIFDLNKRLIERSDTPIWDSPVDWAGETVTFIGLIHFQDRFISYWDLGNHRIFSVVYPSYKIRQSIYSPISPELIRPENNPIISPHPDNLWESSQTFNPAVIRLDDRFHFLYRAIGEDGVSRLGYAVSETGLAINNRLPYPVFIHQADQTIPPKYIPNSSGGSWGGAEDPRLVRVDDEDTIYMTYTAYDGGPRVGFSSIRIDDFINGRWNWKPPICISPPGQVHKNWVIFPEKIKGQYAILHAITPQIQIEYFDNLEFYDKKYIDQSVDPQKVPPQTKGWDKRLRGAGSPPLKTDYGWLMFYHSMNYQVGVMLLDLDDPTKILYRAKAPILESKASYEINGFKPGIVYVSGAVIKDGQLYVYYGGADSYVCVATANLDKFLADLKQQPPQILESAIINKLI